MRIFISYASADLSKIQNLINQNRTVQWDYLKRHIWYKFIWRYIVKHRIKECDYVICAFSERTVDSNNFHWELNLARELGKSIYGIKLNDVHDTYDTCLIDAEQDIAAQIRECEKKKIKDELFHGFGRILQRDREIFFQEYKLIVQTSEDLVKRRQVVNTFFLTLNLALLSCFGIFAKNMQIPFNLTVGNLLFFTSLLIIGLVASWSWKKMICSYGQLNRGKFTVINILEEFLPVMLFQTEWLALGEGRDKKKYSSFTQIEQNIPRWLCIIYALLLVAESILFSAKYLIPYVHPLWSSFWTFLWK